MTKLTADSCFYWCLLALVATSIIAVIAEDIGRSGALILLLIGPFIAATKTKPGHTAVVGVYAVILGLLLGSSLEIWATFDHAIRSGTILLGAGLAVLLAFVRAERSIASSRLAAQQALSNALAISHTIREAAPRVLKAVGEPFGWKYGEFWLGAPTPAVPDKRELSCIARYPSGDDFKHLAQTAEHLGIKRAWKDCTPQWSLKTSAHISQSPFRGEISIPISSDSGEGESLGVLHFGSSIAFPENEETRAMLRSIGNQLGQYVERRGAEEDTREESRRKSAILRAALDAIISMDTQGRIIEWNPAAETTFGYTREEVIGKDMAEIIIPASLRDAHRRGLARYLETGEGPVINQRIEIMGIRRDKEEFPLELAITKIDTNPPTFTGYIRDISERRRSDSLKQQLVAIVESSEDAIISKTLDGIITSWNPAAERLYGHQAADIIGKPIDLIIPEGRHKEEEQAIRERIRHGQSVQRYETTRQHKDNRLLHVALTVSALVDDEGTPVGASIIARDISQERRDQEAQQFLMEATTQLGSSLDYEETLRRLAGLAVPEVADWCAVDILDDQGVIQHVASSHADPSKQEMIQALRKDRPLVRAGSADYGIVKVLRTGEPELYPTISAETHKEVAKDNEHLQILRKLQTRSAMVVPMIAHKRVLGAITLTTAESNRHFSAHDLDFASELARRAAVAIENARLYTEIRAAGKEVTKSRNQLETILEGIADGVTAQIPDGSFIYANEAALDLLGYSDIEALRGDTSSGVFLHRNIYHEDGQPVAAEDFPGYAALGGDDPVDMVVRFSPSEDQDESWSIIKARTVRGEDDAVVLIINIFEDITEQRQNERYQRLFARAGERFGASLDYQETLQTICEVPIPECGEGCILLLHQEGRAALQIEARSGIARHANADAWGRELGPQAISHARPEWHGDLEMVGARFGLPPLQEGIHTLATFPLFTHGQPLGAMMLINPPPSLFTEGESALMKELVHRFASAIENTRLYRDRSSVAEIVQKTLLPTALPSLPGLDLAARHRPARRGEEVGGDFYDVFQPPDKPWHMVIGDVCGKGAEAAGVTSLARYTLRAAAARSHSPASTLRELNQALLWQQSGDRFLTASLCTLTPQASTTVIRLARAGHPAALHVLADGSVRERGVAGGLVGILEDPAIVDEEFVLHPGEYLIFYTDGVTDARVDNRTLGDGYLKELLGHISGCSAADVAERIESAAMAAQHGIPSDDIAILVLFAPDLAREQVLFKERFPALPSAVGEARRALKAVSEHYKPEHWKEIELMISEVATNAVRYGAITSAAWFDVSVTHHPKRACLRFEIRNAGEPFSREGDDLPESDSSSGRGLWLVEQLSSSWGIEGVDETCVWFERPTTEALMPQTPDSE